MVGGIINGVQQSIINSLITIINSVTDLTQICSSLNKSGLAVSIVDDLLTTSDGQNFVVKLATNLVQKGIVTFDKLLSSLQSSGIIVDTLLQSLVTLHTEKLSSFGQLKVWLVLLNTFSK